MILVTVGTRTEPFDRLLRPVDRLAAIWDEPFVVQRGVSTFRPHHASHFRFTTSQHMIRLTAAARVVITHAGAGAIILGLQLNKPLILVPRLRQFGESVDDHQMELSGSLHESREALMITSPCVKSLHHALSQVHRLHGRAADPARLQSALRRQVDLLA